MRIYSIGVRALPFYGVLGVLVFWGLVMPQITQAKSHHVIVCGSGGETAFISQFESWGHRLQRVLIDVLGHDPQHVFLLTESGQNGAKPSSLSNIKSTFERVGKTISNRDDVFVYFIGHGSYRRGVAKLNIVGQDLTAHHVKEWIQKWPARQVVVINAASASAPFINVLSGRRRVICTSTRSAEERNATQFMAFFIQALEQGTADQNRDERISVLEICRQATSLTEAWYAGEGYLVTEHALLDDNGDGKGTRLRDLSGDQGDGQNADQCLLLDMRVPEGTPLAWVEAYRSAVDSVQALIAQKAQLDSVNYYEKLELELVKAAQLNRKIRQKAAPK